MAHIPEPDDPIIIVQFEKTGEAQVRLLMASGNYPTHLNNVAVKWLRDKDCESRLRNEAAQASQMRTALSAKNAAWIAATAAIVAAIISMIGTIVTISAWLWPKR